MNSPAPADMSYSISAITDIGMTYPDERVPVPVFYSSFIS